MPSKYVGRHVLSGMFTKRGTIWPRKLFFNILHNYCGEMNFSLHLPRADQKGSATVLKEVQIPLAEVAELVDALDSKSSSGNRVRVRFPPSVLCSFGSIFFIPNEALKSVGGLIFLPNNPPALCELRRKNAEVVKLVDTHVSGACAFTSVGVRVPPSAPGRFPSEAAFLM